jgi:hypothetical protein
MTSNRHVLVWIDHHEARIFHVSADGLDERTIRYAHKHDATLEPHIVGVETVDHPTDGQLVAYSKRYFASNQDKMGQYGGGTNV